MLYAGDADKAYAPESPGWLSRSEIAATKSSRTSASAAKRDLSGRLENVTF